MRKTFVTIGVASALMAGCGGHEKAPVHQAGKPAKAPARPALAAKNQKPHVYRGPANIPKSVIEEMKTDKQLAAMNHFRSRIYESRTAKVMLGVCATWPNISGGFTATVNPGSAEYKSQTGHTIGFLIFTYQNPRDLSAYEFMNGPNTAFSPKDRKEDNSQNLALEFYHKDGRVKEATVNLSEQPIVDSAGREYFKDKKTHAPIMLTGLAPTADYNEANIAKACHALLHHEELSGILSA